MRRHHLEVPETVEPPAFGSFPKAPWFLSAYVRDVWSRLPELLASATNVFGTIIKIDSTKKVCRKLQGRDAGSASWCTNVGNERGEIVASVLTDSESTESLRRLADGMVDRYKRAGRDPPRVLSTDRDCCCEHGEDIVTSFFELWFCYTRVDCLCCQIFLPLSLLLFHNFFAFPFLLSCSFPGVSKYADLFSAWPDLCIRLDVWHFMRHVAAGCTTESHPLYGVFMAHLSGCIFAWDIDDVNALMLAKKGQMVLSGMPCPTDSATKKAISKDEFARHCRRRTKGGK